MGGVRIGPFDLEEIPEAHKDCAPMGYGVPGLDEVEVTRSLGSAVR
jgi:hypothetical protein